MSRTFEKIVLLLVDFITINLAFWGLLQLRSSFDLFVEQGLMLKVQIFFLVYLYWLVLFVFLGLYQSWYAKSRFDELISVLKAILLGTFIIFVLTSEPERDLANPPTFGRFMIVSYSLLMLICVGGGRFILHTVQRRLMRSGLGQRKTLIIGYNPQAQKLADKIQQFPALGYRVIGFLSLKSDEEGQKYGRIPVWGGLGKLRAVVLRRKVEEVILSLGHLPQKRVMHVIGLLEQLPVSIKIEPDLYGLVMGQARTQQIYGFPLIEINPQIMQPWEKTVKRLMDVFFSLGFLILATPLFLLLALLIKLESPGPVFFKQKRVGKNGAAFTILKFRTMIKDAERYTGPVWAGKRDPRITRLGRIMRKLRLDELPQFINVLSGEMSLVGPRPERPYFVEKLKREYPYYLRRLKVKPGITGWAQVKGEYDTSIEEAREKLAYDLYYIENMSLRMDLRILLYTVAVMLRFKGQ
ncbi:MAG TPA: sugar transferase [bacterium]|nr:sugar transferase [bacterium]HQI47708.1 sugar transferase [bacterium]HQJ63481.1 sugar transferase [bacterium]